MKDEYITAFDDLAGIEFNDNPPTFRRYPPAAPRGSHAPVTRDRCIRSVSRPAFSAPDIARPSGPGSIRAPPLHPCQRLPHRLLPPVRPGIGTDDAAVGAHHARAERWHWHVVGPAVRAQDRPVVTQQHTSSDRTPLARPSVGQPEIVSSCRAGYLRQECHGKFRDDRRLALDWTKVKNPVGPAMIRAQEAELIKRNPAR
jgi:hypothetical protein